MITQPYVNFILPDAGGNVKPISNGTIYIGKEGLDPKLGGNPIYYRDNEGTEVEISNPLYLNATGVIVDGPNSSNIINPYTKSPISILIENQNGKEVWGELFDANQSIESYQLIGLTGLEFNSVEQAKSGLNLSAQILDSRDVQVETSSYYAFAPDTARFGGASYLASTLERVRSYLGNSTWVPDGYGSHYISLGNGSTYVLWITELERNVAHYGAINGGSDDSASVIAMLDDVNYITVPTKFDLYCKNVNLKAESKVSVLGKVLLPNACSDGDLIFKADSVADILIDIEDIDGNKANQSGNIKTQLIELVSCPDPIIHINRAKGNYAPRDYAAQDEKGPVYLENCDNAICRVQHLTDWAREGVWLNECNNATAKLTYAEGTDQEFSGMQISGEGCTLEDTKVVNAGASGISFDVRNGSAGNLVSIGSRFFNGVNFGHPGKPASGSVVASVVSLLSAQDGISCVSGTINVSIGTVTVSASGRHGINQSDSATGLKISGGNVGNSGSNNANIFSGKAYFVNTDLSKEPGALALSVGAGAVVIKSNTRLSEDPMVIQFVPLNGSNDVTVTNGNITADQMPIISPSNANGAGAIPYIKTINNGSMVIGVVNAAPGGAGVRVDIT